MIIRKLSVSLIVLMLVSVSFGMLASDNAQAAFVQTLSNSGLPATFVTYDTAWNEAGTMAVVVGFDGDATPGTNAYAYYPGNDTYWPIDNGNNNVQRLHAADYFRQPIYDWPTVLLVDADCSDDGLIDFYEGAFNGCVAYVDTWQVWQFSDPSYVVKGKPTAADMAPYDLVVWIPSRNMYGMTIPGDALNPTDMQEISTYLNGGGNFFLSNLDFTTYYWSTFTSPGFAYSYLGTNGYGSMSYESYIQPMPADSVFGDLGNVNQDWWAYGWGGSPPSLTDNLWPAPGAVSCFQSWNGGMDMSSNTGIRYDSGIFKSVYFGFPLETVPIWYASDLMQLFLDWISSPDPDQANEYMGWLSAPNVNSMFMWAQSFIPSQSSISAVDFYLYTIAPSSDTYTISIREDNFGQPGAILVGGTVPSGDIPTSPGWVKCEFPGSGTPISVGITYWIVCSLNGGMQQHYWYTDNQQSYANGVAVYHDGMMWSGAMSYDYLFRTYPGTGVGAPKSIMLYPSKDNTIYSENTINSNGIGEYLMAGTDWFPHDRRSLLEFNIVSGIPKYSTINSVQLTLYCTMSLMVNTQDIRLRPVWQEWGEAGSDAAGDESTGTMAATGDATWDYRYYTSATWSMPGGDIGPELATETVGDAGSYYTWESTPALVNSVQSWVDDPALNHGWCLVGNEMSTDTLKWFYSGNYADPNYRPQLIISYTEPTVIGYEDVFWIAGDTYGPTPPATCYKVVPSEELALVPMNDPMSGDPQFFTLAVDDLGNPLCAGSNLFYMYYYDGTGWFTIPSPADLTACSFKGLDFNTNDRRFYATGPDFVFYTDPVPFISAESRVFRFNHFQDYSGSMDGQLAWNELYDYGLFGGDTYLVKIWPYGEYGNGTVRYELINSNVQDHYYDISWDTDGWNEAGITGSTSGAMAYWRYYNSNPQLLQGFVAGAGSGTYYACAMKPPSSPKWLFIPSGIGSLRINIEEKDESGQITVNSEFPHIFSMDMWKQSDAGHLSSLNTQVDADSTYTFAFVGNYTRGGIDEWANLEIYVTGWFDFGNINTASAPNDPTWTSPNHRTSQFNISYNPTTEMATMLYPMQLAPAGPEFSVHSAWQDPTGYGTDGNNHLFYINVTFGTQTIMANGAGTPATGGNIWDRNFALNNPGTWDIRLLIYDSASTTARNATWDEFGVQHYASVSTSGNPTGSIPPGAIAPLSMPTVISYSTNAQYKLNVSIPHLYKDGIVGPTSIAAGYVQVWNDHTNANIANSDISSYTQFPGANMNLIIWGKAATWIQPVGSGVQTSGPMYSDYTAALVPETFEVTEVYWVVEVPVGTPEGTYRGTITITLWS